jgi:hypothetical protein
MSRPFDWRRDCPEDVARRRFPAIAGNGRGREVDEEAVEEARRKMRHRRLTSSGKST